MANTTLQLRFTQIELDGKIWYDSNLIKFNSGALGVHIEMEDLDSHYMAIHHSLSGQRFTSKYHDYFGVLYDNLIPFFIGVGQILKIRLDKMPTSDQTFMMNVLTTHFGSKKKKTGLKRMIKKTKPSGSKKSIIAAKIY